MNQHHSEVAPALSEEAQALALEARAAIEIWHRALAERGLTPKTCLEAVRRTGGEAAVAKAQAQAARTLRALDDIAERDAMHSTFPASSVARRVARRGSV